MRASFFLAIICSVSFVLAGCGGSSSQALPGGIVQSPASPNTSAKLPKSTSVHITEIGTNLVLQACSAIAPDGNPWAPAATSNTSTGTSGVATVSGGAIQFHAGPSDGGGFRCPMTAAPTGVYVFRDYPGERPSDTLSLVSSTGATTVSPDTWITGPQSNSISAAFDSSTGLEWAGVSNPSVFATALIAGDVSNITVSHSLGIGSIGPVAVSTNTIYAFVQPSIDRFSKTGKLLNKLTPPSGFFPTAMIEGPHHDIWFTDVGNNAVGYFTPTGHFVEYPLPSPNANPDSIALSAGKNVWFTEPNARKIGRVTARGHITEYTLPAGGQFGEAISSSGPKARTLWFIVFDGPSSFSNGFGKISLSAAVCDLPASGARR